MEHETVTPSRAVERYVLGEMVPDERDAFEEHFFACRDCAEDIRYASAFVANARAALDEQRLTRPVQTARERRDWFAWLRPAWAPAFAGVLLALLGYQSMVRMPALQARVAALSAPRQVISQTLRPETRGEVPVIESAAGEPLEFSFETAPGAESDSYTAEVVHSDSGAVAFNVPVTVPPDGQPVTISIPDPKLQPGRYAIVLHAARGADRGEEVGRYGFVLKSK
jgi:hypothetical protein